MSYIINGKRLTLRLLFILISIILCHPVPVFPYAILAHEAIIDATWKSSLVPLLKQKYPDATEEDLKKAHAFVYGGAVMPDIGYYPLGRPMFSNLVHYVRTGDFIKNLLEESQNINEYAFALGVLCHYEADCYGHSLATNKAVPILYPQLRKKYGDVVTYEQGKVEHARVEFGFDVLQTAKGNYKPDAYHDFIGFEISDSVLERAFYKTYDIHVKDIFESLSGAVAVFRLSVKSIIPELTRDAWKIKNSFITQLNPLATEKNYRYKMDRKNYRKEFKQPKIQSIFVSVVIGALPKYGPFAKFKASVPNPECEDLFNQSFDSILTHYSLAVKKLKSKPPACENENLDTGKKTEMGEYKLADKTYYKLLMKLKRNKFDNVDEGLRQNLIAYYTKRDSSVDYGNDTHKGKKIAKALEQMNSMQAISTH